jgi:hypothetical protein
MTMRVGPSLRTGLVLDSGYASVHWQCLHFSYPQADSIIRRTGARRFLRLRCIPSQVCFEPLTTTRARARRFLPVRCIPSQVCQCFEPLT